MGIDKDLGNEEFQEQFKKLSRSDLEVEKYLVKQAIFRGVNNPEDAEAYIKIIDERIKELMPKIVK